MLYGLLTLALILSLPACGWLRKNTDQGCVDGNCDQTTETMPVQMEEVEVTETVVPEDMPAQADVSTPSDDAQ